MSVCFYQYACLYTIVGKIRRKPYRRSYRVNNRKNRILELALDKHFAGSSAAFEEDDRVYRTNVVIVSPSLGDAFWIVARPAFTLDV